MFIYPASNLTKYQAEKKIVCLIRSAKFWPEKSRKKVRFLPK